VRSTWLVVGAMTLGSCIDLLEPDVGGKNIAACDPRDSDPGFDVSYANDILPLLLRDRSVAGCSCHIPTNPTHSGFDLTGLDLSTHDSMRRGGVNSRDGIVEPGDPCISVLYRKLGTAPPFGSRMPLSGPPFWSEEELALLHDWIAEGADDD